MTVAAKVSDIAYLENGVTTQFPVPFRYLDPAHLAVDRIAADGTSVPLAYGADYDATAGNDDDGGTLTLAAAGTGTRLRIRRATTRRQDAEYTTGDRFPSALTEDAFDRAMMIAQEMDDALADTNARALLVPIGEAAATLPPVSQRAGKLLTFDDIGTPLAIVAPLDDVAAALALEAKADRRPDDAYSSIGVGYERAWAEWEQRWLNPAATKLRKVYGIRYSASGSPDTTGTLARTSAWMFSIQMLAIYNRWHYLAGAGRTVDAARIAGIILSCWNDFKSQFVLPADFISTTYGGNLLSTTPGTNKVWGLSDDGGWFIKMLENVHRATGDASALGFLYEAIAAIQVVFRDINQTTANGLLIDSGLSTPGYMGSAPIPFRYHRLGYLYTHETTGGVTSPYGRIAHQAELATASAAEYVGGLSDAAIDAAFPGDGAARKALRPRFRDYALNVWTWFNEYMPTGTEAFQRATYGIPAGRETAPGTMFCDLDLSDVTAPKPFRAFFGSPVRGVTAHAEYATLQYGNLSAMLAERQDAHAQDYLAEFRRIADVYTDPRAFGRRFEGLYVTNCLRDPWGAGQAHYEFTWRLRQAFTVDQQAVLQATIVNTGRHVLKASSSGWMTADWGCPEWNPLRKTWLWTQEVSLDWQDSGGGGDAGGGWQAPTAANAMMVVQAAALLTDFEDRHGSGPAPPVSIEKLAAEFAAMKAQLHRLSPPYTDLRLGEDAAIRWNGTADAQGIKGYIEVVLGHLQKLYLHANGSGHYGTFLFADDPSGGAAKVAIGDLNRYISLNADGDMFVNFGVGMSITGRADGTLVFQIGGAVRGYVDATGFHDGAPG